MVASACPPTRPHARTPARRRAGRFAVLVPGAAAIAVLVPLGAPGAAAADAGPPPFPVARALDGEVPLPSAQEVAGLCDGGAGCSFRMYDRAPREFVSGVLSVGNAAINCTDDLMEIDRTVTFVTSSTDNIGGQISGKAALEGGVDTTVTVSGSGTITPGFVTGTTMNGPNKDKGPTTKDDVKNTTEVTGTVSGSNALHLGAKATFESAFQATFSRQWQAVTTESTRVVFTVGNGDEIQFGVVNAMSRAAGELKVNNTGKLIKDITVDSPSSVNVSSVVAQTFSVPDKCLSLRPPGRAAATGLVELPPERAESARRVPDAVYERTSAGTWRQR
ncbi:hypothetical protein [Kitasatospora purpeofusca]|uniref:Uncharacterized protein n=1 Tax=Kitasatospora purpeofusca TaxID=67352 RepID=A0ABZ1TS59_9ACTN|nr:hypothetical protein [Kitasatospora purpeofusca]